VLETDVLREIVERIVERFHPERVILFGSRARGEATADSEMREMVELAKEIGAVLLPLLPRMPQSNTRQGGRTPRM